MASLHSLFRSISPLLAIVTLGSAGCVGDEAEDGIDDSFLDGGKADAFGVEEGSPDAIIVLQLVNMASLDELDNAAGLSSNTSKAIIHHRQGGDRMDGTADDDRIETLTELDSIPYVGPMAFRLLLDEARAKIPAPSTDPFADNFCGQDYSITTADVRAALPEGSQSAFLPTTISGVRVRTRTCVTPDNCPAWMPGTEGNMFALTNTGADPTPAAVAIPAAGVDAKAVIAVATDGRAVLYFNSTVQVDGDTTPHMLDMQLYPAEGLSEDSPISFAGQQLMLDGKNLVVLGTDVGSTSLIGEHCAQAISRVTDNAGATHREISYFARY